MILSLALLVAVLSGIYYLSAQKTPRPSAGGGVEVQGILSKAEKEKSYSAAKEITTPDGFINTGGAPVTISELVGKYVVLIDFWTYSCINCQRTTPYLNAWWEKYKDKGLVIIGIHTPEFEFEKEYQNVLDATQRLEIQYPVVLDNDYSTWNAYKNRFWPRKYLIDIDGYVIYDHIGEGAYEETEKKIQEALAERMAALGENGTISQPITKETPVRNGARSPETYFGSLRNDYLGNGAPRRRGVQNFALPGEFKKNSLYLGGQWNIQEEYAESLQNSKVVYRFSAKAVYVVASAPVPTEVEIWEDGKRVGTTTISESKLYTLIENPDSGEHLLELRIHGGGVRLYAFTFG